MRIKGLDFLRGIAIIGVLCRHVETDFFLSTPGGYGVDLFFVLSGFLVSGLLFSEYKRNGKANVTRFLVRRGFKIYPAFYFFIVASLAIFAWGYGSYFPAPSILSEVFFLQSYIHPMWSHTWSLAVEEHFYLLLALFIFLAIRFRWIEKPRTMISFLLGAIMISSVLRLIYVLTTYSILHEPFYYTHLRIDGLFTGALLGYIWHFHKRLIDKIYERKKTMVLLTLMFIAPAFVFSTDSIFMVTIGFNLLHVAFSFSILMLISEKGEKILFGNWMMQKVSSAICYVGVYSYSIYLWHLPVQNILLRSIHDLRIESIVYMLTAIATGIIASLAIEKPMLRLRDLHFPRT